MGLTHKLDLSHKLEKLKLKAKDSEVPTSSDNLDDIDEVDQEGQSILMGIISQLRPGCDLTKITLPTFILERKSMLERITNFFLIPNLLLEANKTEDPLERFVSMLKWYLASWHIAPKAVKKPLNPVLGEVFSCYWDDLPEGNQAFYVSEQTSHHPPKSSYFYLVPKEKIRVDGVVVPKSKFLGNSSAAIMEGWGHVTLGRWDNEVYIMNQPNMYVRGILFGKMKMELGDHMYVKCAKSGYEADIDFKTKGYISGTYDAIEGFIKDTNSGEKLYTISGKWNGVMEIKDLKTGATSVLFDTAKSSTLDSKVRPLNEQMENESRKLWKATVDALGKRDHETATEEKLKVENEQRDKAKQRLDDGEEFHPKLFRRVENDETDIADMEYVIYKDFNLQDDEKTLTESLLDAVPILPGQKVNDKLYTPAFEKSGATKA